MLCSIVKFDRFNLFGLRMSNVSVIEMRVVLNFGLVTFMYVVYVYCADASFGSDDSTILKWVSC